MGCIKLSVLRIAVITPSSNIDSESRRLHCNPRPPCPLIPLTHSHTLTSVLFLMHSLSLPQPAVLYYFTQSLFSPYLFLFLSIYCHLPCHSLRSTLSPLTSPIHSSLHAPSYSSLPSSLLSSPASPPFLLPLSPSPRHTPTHLCALYLQVFEKFSARKHHPSMFV